MNQVLSYVVLAGASALDHSGLPLPLLAAVSAAPALGIQPLWAFAAAFAGGLAVDVLLLLAGRWVGADFASHPLLVQVLGRLPSRVVAHVGRRPNLALVAYRYVPGIGKYAPLAAGIERTPLSCAIPLCGMGGALYTLIFGAVGLVLQPGVVAMLQDSRRVWVASVLALVIALVVVWRRYARGTAESRNTLH